MDNRILVLQRVEQWQALRVAIAAYRSLFPADGYRCRPKQSWLSCAIPPRARPCADM
jgi:hypothetical protein